MFDLNKMLNVSSNPHIRDTQTTQMIMLDVIIALLPASIFGVYNFGFRALFVILVTVATAVLTEFLYEKFMNKKITIYDLSAVVTGLLLALNLPSTIPFWIAALGAIFAILIVKQIFGGLGQNFMNPALAARCFLLLSFTGKMTTFTYDGVTGATPLYNIKTGESYNVLHMFLGNTAGTIGETSVLALLIGAVYLLMKKLIDFRIPVFYIGTFAIFAVIYSACNGGVDASFVAAQLCGGGLMLGAWFMATDYVTSPVTPMGRIVFGICLGLLTGAFRFISSENAAPEGVSYAIVFCNLLVPLIEKVTVPKAFGKNGGNEKV